MQRSRWNSLGIVSAAAFCVAVALVVPDPASAQDTASTAASKPAKKFKKGNSSLITESEVELAAGSASNAYEVIEKVRPAMLRRRGGPSSSEGEQPGILVYLDDVRVGELGLLRNIPTSQIKEIRYLNATDATQRWGTGVPDGVIQVVSRR